MATLVSRMATKNSRSVTESTDAHQQQARPDGRGRAAPASGRRRAKTTPSTMPAVAKRSTSRALSGAVAHSTSAPMQPHDEERAGDQQVAARAARRRHAAAAA